MTVHIAASREADGRARSKAYRYSGAIAQALVRNGLNPTSRGKQVLESHGQANGAVLRECTTLT